MTDLSKRDDAPKTCPFCKCKDVTTWFDREQGDKWGYASCDGCGGRGPEVRTKYVRGSDAPWRSDAIATWNTRALPAIDPAAIREAALTAKLAKAMDALRFYSPEIIDGIEFGGGDDAGRTAAAVLAELEGQG